ncbi:phosphatidylserine/phosphatidylglycerophosphate/cardiolipin synthase family protein [bacterium]|nr:MAG: phosphatidylserine/phosphatidylglycerophosphate/cardiolipin synthase family protein [bacterium]
MVRVACLLIPLCLVGCSNPAQAADYAGRAQGASGMVPAVGASGGAEAVRLWQDASIFQLVGGLIGSAHTRVLVEMYELGRADLVQELGAARRRGAEVRVITDPTVGASRRGAAVLDSLAVPERAYPVDGGRHQIDHVKLLIADGEAAVGGMNWGRHSDRNHDYVLATRVRAEVDRLVRIFDQDWNLAGGRPAPLRAEAAEVAQTAPGEEIRAMLEAALNHASQRALAEVYTLTDPEVIAGLVSAHRRGALVRVLLDPNQAYNRHAYEVLRAGGVEVRWYPIPKGALLHAKIGLFDGELVLGSANWTRSGLGVNHELDIETGDPVARAAYAARFAADWERSGGLAG